MSLCCSGVSEVTEMLLELYNTHRNLSKEEEVLRERLGLSGGNEEVPGSVPM